MSQTLAAIRQASEALLAEGAADFGSLWRSPTLITVGADAAPQARTVVLRRFDPNHRILEIHTDARSAKATELKARPEASLHGWDAARHVQLRLTGRVTLHGTGQIANAAWASLGQHSRQTYRLQPGPGTVLAAPEEITQASDAEARAVFLVILLVYDTLEYLDLAQPGHRRARFTWNGGALTSEWLVP